MQSSPEGANARAAIYTRISKDLALEGLGVARQLQDCRALAEKYGWNVVEEFEDNDISASGNKTRPAYLRLKALMESGAIDVVVVYSADRLHRNPRMCSCGVWTPSAGDFHLVIDVKRVW